MITVFGMPSCPYCAYVYEQIKDNPEFMYIDIGKDVKALHRFLQIRDTCPTMMAYKQDGDVGIPCFVRQDGSVSLEPKDFGLRSYSETLSKAVCRLDGKGC